MGKPSFEDLVACRRAVRMALLGSALMSILLPILVIVLYSTGARLVNARFGIISASTILLLVFIRMVHGFAKGFQRAAENNPRIMMVPEIRWTLLLGTVFFVGDALLSLYAVFDLEHALQVLIYAAMVPPVYLLIVSQLFDNVCRMIARALSSGAF